MPWPRNHEDMVVIPYCYMAKKDRTNIRNIVENAMSYYIQ
jgi:hypothetical protein